MESPAEPSSPTSALDNASVRAARVAFPCGLEHPKGAFRSGLDALLLARFIPSLSSLRFVELGVGSGMAACALALRLEQAQGTGVDVHPEALACAVRNAAMLGLEQRLCMAQADIRDHASLRSLFSLPLDVVLANPPYREQGSGRASPSPMREAALCGPPDTLDTFCAAARLLLRHHGRFCFIYPAARLGHALECLRRHGLAPRRLQCVHTQAHRPARRVLLEGRKDCAEDMTIEPPLLVEGDNSLECSVGPVL